ncbi:MAG: hypothetical protein ACRDNI_10910 [Gaiellaceae bacterium]
MNESGNDATPEQEPDPGWDETVLVWNATVARIPASADEPGGDRPSADSSPREASRVPRA